MYALPRLNDPNRELESLHAGPERRARSFDPWAWSLVFGLVLSAFVLGAPFAERGARDPGPVADPGAISGHGADPCLVAPARASLGENLPTIGGSFRVPG